MRYFVTFIGEIDRWIDTNEHELRQHMKPQDWLNMYSILIEDYGLDFEQLCFNTKHENGYEFGDYTRKLVESRGGVPTTFEDLGKYGDWLLKMQKASSDGL